MDAANELSIQRHLAANSSNDADAEFVLLLSDTFTLESPNGKHTCFVTEPMGPSISTVLNATPEFYDPLNPPTRRFPTVQSKRFLKNVLSGLKYLHSNRVVHGDVQSGNMLFSLGNLTTRNLGELELSETAPTIEPLLRVDGKIDRWAPKYLIVPEPLSNAALPDDEQVVKLADFGGGRFNLSWCHASSSLADHGTHPKLSGWTTPPRP